MSGQFRPCPEARQSLEERDVDVGKVEELVMQDVYGKPEETITISPDVRKELLARRFDANAIKAYLDALTKTEG